MTGQKRGLMLALLVLLAGACVALILWRILFSLQEENVVVRFQRDAQERALAIRDRVNDALESVYALQGLYEISDHVNASSFTAFCRPVLEHFPHVYALEWVERVEDADRSAYEETLAGNGALTSFIFDGEGTRSPPRNEYFPVTVTAPIDQGQPALGFDLASEEQRRAALNRARDSGQLTITGRIELIHDPARLSGIRAFLPVYRRGGELQTVAERRAHLRGFVSGVFRVAPIVERALDRLEAVEMDVIILDDSAADGAPPIYARLHDSGAPSRSPGNASPNRPDYAHRIHLGGHVWDILLIPDASYLDRFRGIAPLLTLVTTFLVSLLAAGYVMAMSGRASKVEEEVRERTYELNLANAALARQAGELERSNAELDDFAYIASHDLKEPLRGIHNYSMFLLEDYGKKLDDEALNRLRTLVALTQRMEGLIDSLLTYSRLGRQALNIKETSLDEIARTVIADLDPFIKEHGAEVRVPRPLPALKCDRDRIAQVFQNLIVNGVKYNDKEHRTVEVGWEERAAAREGAAARTVLFVRDNGIGIHEKHRDQIFRIFKRLHARDKYGGGAGAGLTIVKKIVERHGGKIWFESEPDEGATFFFTLDSGGGRP